MAFRRNQRRRTSTRTKIRRMVSNAKHQQFKNAVLAIAKEPVETKHFPRYYDWNVTVVGSGYATGPGWAIRGHCFREIPRADSAITKTVHEVIGDELESRGFWIRVNLRSDVNANTQKLALDCRLTVYSMADVPAGMPIIEGVLTNDYIYDPDLPTYQTAARFNTDVIHVLKSKKFQVGFTGSNGNVSREVKLWVPITGRKTAREEESTLSSSTFGFLKGRQYFWLLEMYCQGQTSGIGEGFTSKFTGDIQTKIYFKDA